MEPCLPRRYSLTLDLDLDRGTFHGQVTIEVELASPHEEVILDASGLAIEAATIDGRATDHETVEDRLVLRPRHALAAGASQLTIRFRSGRTASPGLRIDGAIAISRFQPRNARTAFPCFDDLRFKTPFDVTVTAPATHTAVTCAEVASIEAAGHGRRRTRFATSPSLTPSSLVIAAVPWTAQTDGGIRVHAARPERLATGVAASALAFLSEWLDVPYPWPSLQILAVPAYGAAGMESTGVVIFREDEIAAAPAGTIQAARAARLVAHEIAHQWFGALVTPASWSDLWISEGFATFLASKAVRHLLPSSQHEVDEVLALRAAMAEDNIPLRPQVPSSEAAEHAGLFSTVIYEKGAALLRDLESLLGEDVFRRAVSRLVQSRAGGHASTEDVFRTFEELSGKNLSALRSMTDAAGAPLVELQWRGRTLRVSGSLKDHRVIPLRLEIVTAGGARERRVEVVEGTETTLETSAPIDWIFANSGGLGYYGTRGTPIPDSAAAMLTDGERIARLCDAWDAVWRGDSDILEYLSILTSCSASRNVSTIAAQHIADLRDILASGQRRESWNAWVRDRWTHEPFDGRTLTVAGQADQPRAVSRAGELTEAWLKDGTTDDALEAALPIAAEHGSESLFDRLHETLNRGAEGVRLRTVAAALGAFRLEARRAEQEALLVAGTLEADQAGSFLETLLADPTHRAETWSRLFPHLAGRPEQVADFAGRGMLAAIGTVTDARVAAHLAQWKPELPPRLQPIADATCRRIESRLAFREREQRSFDAWLVRRNAPAVDLRAAAPAWETLNFLAAGFHAAAQQQRWLASAGVQRQEWMQADADVIAAARGLDARLLQTLNGNAIVDAAVLSLGHRLAEDLMAAARWAEISIAGVLATDREAATILAGFLLRREVFRDRFMRGAITLADLAGEPAMARQWRESRRRTQEEIQRTQDLVRRAAGREASGRLFFDLWNECALLPALLRAQALDCLAMERRWKGETEAAPPQPWQLFGFADADRERWTAAGFTNAADAGEWFHRGFAAEEARELATRGADPRAVRRERNAPPEAGATASTS
jgi:hypothetical protein